MVALRHPLGACFANSAFAQRAKEEGLAGAAAIDRTALKKRKSRKTTDTPLLD